MTAATQTLADWILACIAEDEAKVGEAAALRAKGDHEPWCMDPELADGHCFYCGCEATPDEPSARVLAECEAKRRIVNAHRAGFPDEDRYAMGWHDFHIHALCILALPYADREGYRDEWRP